MKIDPDIIHDLSHDHFSVVPTSVFDRSVLLVRPRASQIWTKDTLIFRSSVWSLDGELISAGFPKFFNIGEEEHLYPPIENFNDVSCMEKIDGSCLIVSPTDDGPVIRTRGSIDTMSLENHHEIDIFKDRYSHMMAYICGIGAGYSYLFEWVSPANQIVLNYSGPEWYLVGIVAHEDYSLISQAIIDLIAAKIWNVPRPKIHSFDSTEHMMETVKTFQGIEGICAYYNEDQNIVKVKSMEYLTLHHFKFSLTFDKVVSMFVDMGRPSYDDMKAHIAGKFDYECMEISTPFLERLYSAITTMEAIVNDVRSMNLPPTRKEIALLFKDQFKDWAHIAFMAIDNPDALYSARIIQKTDRKICGGYDE